MPTPSPRLDQKSPWIPIGKWEDAGYEWPSEDALRMYWRNRHENGFSDAFMKHGRLTLVNPERFFALLEGGQAA